MEYVELFKEHPIATVIAVFLILYVFWYYSGGVERALERRAAADSASVLDRVEVDYGGVLR